MDIDEEYISVSEIYYELLNEFKDEYKKILLNDEYIPIVLKEVKNKFKHVLIIEFDVNYDNIENIFWKLFCNILKNKYSLK